MNFLKNIISKTKWLDNNEKSASVCPTKKKTASHKYIKRLTNDDGEPI